MAFGARGQPCWVEGRVTDAEGAPVAGAKIEVWEADEDGFYDVQYSDERTAARAHLFSEEDGSWFWGLTPTPYPIPLRRAGRHDARGSRPVPGAHLAPALHGHRPRPAHARHTHLRGRLRVPGTGQRLRGQGVAHQGLPDPAPPTLLPPTVARSRESGPSATSTSSWPPPRRAWTRAPRWWRSGPGTDTPLNRAGATLCR